MTTKTVNGQTVNVYTTAELQEFVYKVLAFGRGVTDWEQNFCKDMEGKQSYSEKQACIIERIYAERTA